MPSCGWRGVYAGITGPDGASRHAMWDASWLGDLPALPIAAARDGNQSWSLSREATEPDDGPSVLRVPKGASGENIEAVRRTGSVDVLSETRYP